VHGAGGTLGALLTGIFATCVINPIYGKDAANIPTGAIDGHWGQVLNQLAGVGVAWGISIAGTLILLFVVDKIMGLRVTPEQEHVAPGSLSAWRGGLRLRDHVNLLRAVCRAFGPEEGSRRK
jgi:ammonia channel protein AmtB